MTLNNLLFIFLVILVITLFFNKFLFEEKFKNKNYLIYKGSGGFFHCLSGLITAIDIAEKNDCILVIDIKNHSGVGIHLTEFFKDNFLKKNKIIMTEDYNYIPNNLKFYEYSKKEIINNGGYTIKGNIYFFKNKNVRNIKIKSDAINIYIGYNKNKISKLNLKIKDNIKKKIIDKRVIDGDYISVHFRNTDMKNDTSLFIKKILECSNKFNCNKIFIATDNYDFYFELLKHKNLKIYRNTKPNKDIKNLHYSKTDKKTQMFNLLCDLYYIFKSKYFIPSVNSGVSKYVISCIQDKNNNNFFDIKNKPKIINLTSDKT